MKSYYTQNSIRKKLRYKELLRSGISSSNFQDALSASIDSLKDGSFEFDIIKKQSYYKIDSIVHKLILRQVNYRLKKTYKDYQSNRRTIINQIIALLNQESEYYVIRTDVSSFYESIDKMSILKKIKEDRIINYESIFLIEKVLLHAELPDIGVPRGLSISSTLSEIYMRSFDRKIRSTEGVYFYARFVDGIIIFVTDKVVQGLITEQMENWLPDGLSINKRKTSTSSSMKLMQGKNFEYLGYRFEVEKKSKKFFNPKISIADKKLNKIKSRISYAFADYCNRKDFPLLLKRIDFLSCNYVLRGGEKSKLMAGMSYNYSKLSHFDDLDALNMHYQKIINSKNHNFGHKIQSAFSSNEINILGKCSFKHRYKNKVVRKFTTEEIMKIKKCWAHEN